MQSSRFRRTLSRRTLVAGAAAGTMALAVAPAQAQRCPPAPARNKGPLVWMNLDQQDLDEAYDQSVYAFNQRFIQERRDERNELMAKVLGKPDRVAYGPAEIEKVDIYKAKRPNAPTMIFLHGGAWRGGTSAQGAYHAEPFVKAGAHFINVEFNNVLETKGDLMPMVDQCRRAVAWVYKNAASFGGDPGALYLSGFSSGGHLGGCVVITDWEKQGLPRNILKGAVLGSGMYDLKPVRMSARSSYVKFTDEMEQALSAMRHLDMVHTPLVLTIGLLETPEFQRQSRDFAAAVAKAGKPVQLIAAKGHNHFEMGESLSNPYGIMGRAALEMMKLTSAA
ncbi:MAG: alpha/beta hydrolase [Xanthobacteraceae bacterium]|nr:alpha/beta hydrolase [Xanthobacteraceae bacterium]